MNDLMLDTDDYAAFVLIHDRNEDNAFTSRVSCIAQPMSASDLRQVAKFLKKEAKRLEQMEIEYFSKD
jgi:hypothetical protein